VTAKPQTTRSRILGIHTLPDAQMLIVDTPGLHESSKLLNVALNDAVSEAARSCDVGVVLVDLTGAWQEVHQGLFDALRRDGKPVVIAGTKCDLASADARSWLPAQADDDSTEAIPHLPVSGLTGEGVSELRDRIVACLPESPSLYPEDALTDRPLRWLAGELVRESVFEGLDQELPYEIAVEVLKYDESRPDQVTIHANVLVRRSSQKRIVVGGGGEMIKRIGTRARLQIERLVGCKVHLQLFVKVDPKWLQSARRIESLGYH
jgi:GTP-binding protein Era